ncbi:MAG TPA: glycosyltransferase family 4 protein [Parafilimonas sp.]|nr:glycosyltransferase family 4 protein [Parafilimonas sp.]
MFKILILSHNFFPDVGGIETNSEILANAFHNSGAEVRIMTWSKSPEKNNFPFTVIRDPGLGTIVQQHRWADVVFENNPCLRMSWPNIFIRKPLVIALNTWVNRLTGNKGFRDKLKNLWFGRARSVIAVSNAIRNREWHNAVVIENPYNDSLFKNNAAISKSVPFVFLGRLVSDKGADQAIRAVSILAEEGLIDRNRLQLTIIGNGAETANLIQLREELDLCGAVHFTGVLKGKELMECLNRHRFILVPSMWEEPYGNVVLEGMACGCIPIASDGGGMPEAVGKAGFVFKRNDLAAMTGLMRELLNEPRKIETALENSHNHLEAHSVELVSQKYYSIIKAAALG